MNSLRLPRISPSWVNGDAPAKINTGTRPLAALCKAPASACVPHSTWTRTACARPVTCAKPCAALSATISFGQVIRLGAGRPVPPASARLSMIAGWSLPRFAKMYETPASCNASINAVLAVYIESSSFVAKILLLEIHSLRDVAIIIRRLTDEMLEKYEAGEQILATRRRIGNDWFNSEDVPRR